MHRERGWPQRLRRRLRLAGFSLLLAGVGVTSLHGKDAEHTPITVRPGDTPWSMARRYLKDPMSWDAVIEQNAELLWGSGNSEGLVPGTSLKFPTALLKPRYQAAKLLQVLRRVLTRRKDTTGWHRARTTQRVYPGDDLRTLEKSYARVRFHNGALLDMGPNSFATLKPVLGDHDLRLGRGSIQASDVRVRTQAALIEPEQRGTRVGVRVEKDQGTHVQVITGAAKVTDAKGRKSVVVSSGHQTRVAIGSLPDLPKKIPNATMRTLRARSPRIHVTARMPPPDPRISTGSGAPSGEALTGIVAELREFSMPLAVTGYRVQVAWDRGFDRLVWSKTFNYEEEIDLRQAGLTPGSYWVRMAVIDLLDEQGEFSKPRQYRVPRGGSVP